MTMPHNRDFGLVEVDIDIKPLDLPAEWGFDRITKFFEGLAAQIIREEFVPNVHWLAPAEVWAGRVRCTASVTLSATEKGNQLIEKYMEEQEKA